MSCSRALKTKKWACWQGRGRGICSASQTPTNVPFCTIWLLDSCRLPTTAPSQLASKQPPFCHLCESDILMIDSISSAQSVISTSTDLMVTTWALQNALTAVAEAEGVLLPCLWHSANEQSRNSFLRSHPQQLEKAGNWKAALPVVALHAGRAFLPSQSLRTWFGQAAPPQPALILCGESAPRTAIRHSPRPQSRPTNFHVLISSHLAMRPAQQHAVEPFRTSMPKFPKPCQIPHPLSPRQASLCQIHPNTDFLELQTVTILFLEVWGTNRSC